jgi:membrane peptidoglycan carboxypeptidase
VARGHVRQRAGRGLPVWAWVLLTAPVLGMAALVALFALATSSATAAGLSVGLLDNTIGHIPQPRSLPADSLIYDRSRNLLADVHPAGESRLPVTLDQVSPWLQKATVDIEDRNFWHEGAVDPVRILAAAWNDVRGTGGLQGASTITQQLAKVDYLNDAPTLGRKLRELFVARHLEQSMSKQQILQEYLNDIPYGHGATGIQAAARTYFNTDASQLNLAQASLLAGLPDAPTVLDPLLHLDAAQARQKLVLQAMVQAGDITMDQAAAAMNEQLTFSRANGTNLNAAPAFVARVNAELGSSLKLDPTTAGLRVLTTLDPNLQQLAQQSVAKQVAALASNSVTDGALVSIDPAKGDVLAYIGSAGPNVPGAEIDMAAAPRQPGSTFKLFTYSTAIGQRKVTMLTPVLDAPYSLPTGGGANGMGAYQVINYDQKYHGMLPVAQALGNSLNVPAVKVEMYTGISNIVSTAQAMGVSALNQAPQSYTPSLTLGAYPVPLWQMAQAATVFATGGKLQPVHFVQSATDQGGRELLPRPAAPKQVMDPATVFVRNQILTNDANRTIEFGPNSALTVANHTVAAKTGTTNDFKDNLTIGWTPKLVTATWVGNADNHAMQGTTGISGAAPIWHEVMTQALGNVGDDWPGPPPGVHQTTFEGKQGWLLDGTNVTYVPELTGGARGPASSARPSASASSSSSASPSASSSPSTATAEPAPSAPSGALPAPSSPPSAPPSAAASAAASAALPSPASPAASPAPASPAPVPVAPAAAPATAGAVSPAASPKPAGPSPSPSKR